MRGDWMILRSLERIQEMVSGEGLRSEFFSEKIAGVSIDTRSLIAGNLYIPIIRIDDGHKYAEDAITKGASALLWQKDQPNPPQGIPIIFVEDTLIALQSLAKAYRDQLNLIVIGITGSNGKTTTKD
ncbi:UDP-N-acetylmuramoyl-tripeptide--D-alanyl-D-alanine ligase, partial [Halorubrum sp. Atlit-9R]